MRIDRLPNRRLALLLSLAALYSAISVRHVMQATDRCRALSGSPGARLKVWPDRAIAGEQFNVQKHTGLSAIAVIGPCLPVSGSIFWNSTRLKSKWSSGAMTATVPDSLIAEPEQITVAVCDNRGFRSEGRFVIYPRGATKP